MYYAYVLRSLKNLRLYTGYSYDLKNRLKKHNSKQGGAYTSKNAPFEILFYEAFKDKRDAIKAEKFWKTGYGREVLKDKIKYSLVLVDTNTPSSNGRTLRSERSNCGSNPCGVTI